MSIFNFIPSGIDLGKSLSNKIETAAAASRENQFNTSQDQGALEWFLINSGLAKSIVAQPKTQQAQLPPQPTSSDQAIVTELPDFNVAQRPDSAVAAESQAPVLAPEKLEETYPDFSSLPQVSVVESKPRETKKIQSIPAVDAAFEELIKTYPKEDQEYVRALRNYRNKKAEQQRSSLSNAFQLINRNLASEIESIRQGALDLPPEAHQYGAVSHEINREIAIAKRNAELAAAQLSVSTMEPSMAHEKLKLMKDEIDKRYDLRRFDEMPQYKEAMTEKARLSKDIVKQQNFSNAISTMKDYLEKGERGYAAGFGRATVAQMANSLVNDNAIQTTEMLIRYPDLLSAIDLNQLQGKGVFSLTNLLKKAMSPDERQKAINEVASDPGLLKGLLNKVYDTQPERFLRFAIDAHNANAKALNDQIENNVVKPTSPKVAGMRPLPMIEQLPSVQQAQQAGLPQTTIPQSQTIKTSTGTYQYRKVQ